MKNRILFILLISFLITSCIRRNYTCECIDSSGELITETGWYTGNDANNYIRRVETNFEDELDATCDCRYD